MTSSMQALKELHGNGWNKTDGNMSYPLVDPSPPAGSCFAQGDLVIVSDSPGCTDTSMPVPATALDSEEETQTEIDSSDSNADGE